MLFVLTVARDFLFCWYLFVIVPDAVFVSISLMLYELAADVILPSRGQAWQDFRQEKVSIPYHVEQWRIRSVLGGVEICHCILFSAAFRVVGLQRADV